MAELCAADDTQEQLRERIQEKLDVARAEELVLKAAAASWVDAYWLGSGADHEGAAMTKQAGMELGLLVDRRRVQDFEVHKMSPSILHAFEGHAGKVVGLHTSRDGLVALSCAADRTVKLWEVSTGRCERFHGKLAHGSVVLVIESKLVEAFSLQLLLPPLLEACPSTDTNDDTGDSNIDFESVKDVSEYS